jgi:hypothetical protein
MAANLIGVLEQLLGSSERRASRRSPRWSMAPFELEALTARLSEIPDVGAVIKPAADALVDKMRAMAA